MFIIGKNLFMRFIATIIRKRFALLTGILLLTNVLVFAFRIWPQYPVYSHYDGWFVFVREFKKLFLNPYHVMFSDIDYTGYELKGYWHAFTPLYPFVAAAISLIAGNLIASMIITSALFSVIGVYFARRISIEYLKFDGSRTFQLLAILISLNGVSHFFMVPITVSMTFAMPIIDVYYVLRFFYSPHSRKNQLILIIVFTLTLLAREVLWPVLLVPLAVLILLRWKISRQKNTISLDFPKKAMVLTLTTILIPIGLYGVYLFSTGTFDSIFLQARNISLCPKTLIAFFYSLFNTVTFNWIFILFNFMFFLYKNVFNKSHEHVKNQPVLEFNGSIYPVEKENLYLSFDVIKLNSIQKEMQSPKGSGNVESTKDLDRFYNENLVDFINGTWFLALVLSRLVIPGCIFCSFYVPAGFMLAINVYKGTRITRNTIIHELLFWNAIGINFIVLVLQVFYFYPFYNTNFTHLISEWLGREIGWPFY
jgi:hypothetical protein